jgi:hypothetical protein
MSTTIPDAEVVKHLTHLFLVLWRAYTMQKFLPVHRDSQEIFL